MKLNNKLKRDKRFLGIHFDFHANSTCENIGGATTEQMIEDIITKVKPDYIQCDCKGHPGFSSYPTKVGNPAPHIAKDALSVWREVTARHNVGLYMHYSGVWDTEALRKNPEWARIDENGEQELNNTSVFGPYVDELLIPQIKELAGEYGVDGVWIDGDCWACGQDYSQYALKQFKIETAINTIPKNPDDPHFYEFSQFCREGFRKYLRHYVDEIHKDYPNFQVASNWAFSSFMPEPISADVDFISGDYPLLNSVNSARFEGRCLVNQAKSWDLMAWAFAGRFGEAGASTKTAVQIKQEAAVVLSLGGGFQAYFTQREDGSVRGWQMEVMGEVAKFCRERQNYCHEATPIPQIALLYSSYAYYKQNKRLFSTWQSDILDPMKGILNCLLDGQNCVEVVMEHHLFEGLQKYPMIIIPEWAYLEEKFKEKLLSYAENGGNLLLIGAQCAKIFESQLGVTFVGEIEKNIPKWLEHNNWLSGNVGDVQKVSLNEDAYEFGRLHSDNEEGENYITAASISKYGKGKIATMYFNMGCRYLNGATSGMRNYLSDLVRELNPEPLVEVKGSHFIDVTVNTIGDKIMVNLVNMSGHHSNDDVYIIDEIPCLGPLDIQIRLHKEPDKILLQPVGTPLDYKYSDRKVNIRLDKLEIHSVIVIE